MRVSKDIFDEWMTKLEDSMDKLTSRKRCSKPAFLKVLNKGNSAELQNALWGKTEKNMKYLEAHCDLFRIQKKINITLKHHIHLQERCLTMWWTN